MKKRLSKYCAITLAAVLSIGTMGTPIVQGNMVKAAEVRMDTEEPREILEDAELSNETEKVDIEESTDVAGETQIDAVIDATEGTQADVVTDVAEETQMDGTTDAAEEIQMDEVTDATEEINTDTQQEKNLPIDSTDEIQESTEIEEELTTEQEIAKEEIDSVSGETLTASGMCGENISWKLYGDTLKIDGTGPMTNYGEDSPEWDKYRLDIKSVIVSSGVTSIGECAFIDCSNLSEISIPETVTSIGAGAFYYCTSLSKINIPEGVTSIGASAFNSCESLSKLSIPDGVTSIGEFTFNGCYGLKEIHIPKAVTSIGYGAFWGCEMSEINLPEGLTTIAESAFRTCSNLKEVSIPKTVTSIDACAFYNCENLSKISILNKNCKIYSSKDTISNTAVICGYTNSTAETYAKKYNRSFQALDAQSSNTYTITYNANGGKNAPSAQKKQKNKTLTLSKGKPTRTGYTFLGWSTSKSSTKATYAAGASFKENKNTTLYAVWKANTYKIVFDKNGGTGSMTTISCTYGKNYTLAANTFKRKGYTFKGWNTKADGTGKYSYTDKATVKNVSSVNGKTMKLYAQWTANKYKIAFDKNGGTGSMATISCTYGKNYTLAANTFKRKGYTFKGWNTKPDGTGTYSYADKATVKNVSSVNGKTMKLYAQWTANKYKIAFDKNGGTGSMTTISCIYGKNYTLPANTFKRTGYTFKGWNTKADGTGTYSYTNKATVKNVSSVNGKTMKLYAQWTKNTQNAIGQCITLSEDKTYKYNLDGIGSAETIKYTITKGEEIDDFEYNYTVNVYVNDENIYTKQLRGWSSDIARVMVTDVDSSDKKMELLILEGDNLYYSWSSNIEHIQYYKYELGKAVYVQDLVSLFKDGYTSNIYEIHGISDSDGKFFTIDGKGNLKANVCLEFADHDYKHFQRTVTLKDGKFTVKTVSENALEHIEFNDYTMEKDLNSYTTAGGKTVSVVLKKGKTVIVTGIYRTSEGKLYFKVKYNEKYGYVLPSTFIKNASALGCLHV